MSSAGVGPFPYEEEAVEWQPQYVGVVSHWHRFWFAWSVFFVGWDLLGLVSGEVNPWIAGPCLAVQVACSAFWWWRLGAS